MDCGSIGVLSREQVVDHLAMHVCQPEIAAGVAIGKFLVIESEEVKQRRVQIVHVDLVLGGREAELIRGAVHDTLLQSATREPRRKPVRIVIAAVHHS